MMGRRLACVDLQDKGEVFQAKERAGANTLQQEQA